MPLPRMWLRGSALDVMSVTELRISTRGSMNGPRGSGHEWVHLLASPKRTSNRGETTYRYLEVGWHRSNPTITGHLLAQVGP